MKALVTGGGGFVGKRIVELLLEEGHEVRFLARGRYPEVEALGAEGLQVDLVDADAVKGAAEGCDVVFHVASMVKRSGAREQFYAVNVTGTDNVIEACVAHDIPVLVYTSTPSVCGYATPFENATDLPYAKVHKALYPESKAEAERHALAANGRELPGGGTLRTVSLRPHLVFGPGDPKLIPQFAEAALAGRLKIIGDGTNVVDLTFVDNAAWAHLDAWKALRSDAPACAGKAYFISNDEPVPLWGWFNELLPKIGGKPIEKKIPIWLATLVATAMETAWNWLPLSGEPRLTPFMVSAMGETHWYSMEPAKRDFGYHIRVDMDEGTRRQIEWMNAP